jgi:hypothetical protein
MRAAVMPRPWGGAKPASPAYILFLLWSVLTGFCLIVLLLDARQPRGILFLDWFLIISVRQRLLPLAALGLGGLAFAVAVQKTGLARGAAALPAKVTRHWRIMAWLTIGIGVAGALTTVWILRAFPNSGDEYDYLFAAKTFVAGRLWNPVPPLPDLFAHFHILSENGKWVAGYPPGWPLLLAIVIGLRLPPWLACPLAGGLLLFVVFKIGQLRDGTLGGVLAVVLIAVSPFFLFNAGSYFDMVPAAGAGALFCWAALKFLDRPGFANAISAGLALGALGLIRSQDVLLFALTFAAQFLWRARRHHYRLAPVIVLSGLPFLIALLLYNSVVFGSPLPHANLEFPTVRFGLFPVDESGNHMTPLDELHFAVARMVMLAEWTSPLLVLGYVPAFRFVAERRRLSFIDFVFPAYVLGFMLVPFGGGNQYGPRYDFEGFPFLVLTLVSALTPLLRDAERPRRQAFFASLIMAHSAICLAAVTVFAPFMRTVVDQRMDVYDQVDAAHLHNAVVILRSGTSPLRPMGPRDLTRNGIGVGGPVIYVRDIPGELEGLRRLFPGRCIYVYERAPLSSRGNLHAAGPEVAGLPGPPTGACARVR